MLTAILVVAILSLMVSSLAVIFAGSACGWARASHNNCDFLLTAILKTQGEHADLLENQSECLDRIDETLLITSDTVSAVEQLFTASEKVLEQNTLVALDTLAAARAQ